MYAHQLANNISKKLHYFSKIIHLPEMLPQIQSHHSNFQKQ